MGLTLAIWVDDVIAAHGCGLRLKMSRNFSNRARLYDTMSALASQKHRYQLISTHNFDKQAFQAD